MKRITAAALALALALLTLASAAADGLSPLFAAADSLLFETENVTLRGQADFLLDGVRFKTAESVHVQDGWNASWQLKLRTPRGDEERESGFTITANGGKIYIIEAIHPGVYRTATDGAQRTILRNSVQAGLMRRFAAALAAQPEALLGAGTVEASDSADGPVIRVTLGGDVPELANTALNLFAAFAVKRYFGVDYDHLSWKANASMSDYLTVSQGLVASVRQLSLGRADLTFRLDSDGRLAGAEGSLSLNLLTARDGEHTLDITFQADVSGWDESSVADFDPEAFGVVLAEDAMDLSDLDFWDAYEDEGE